MWWVLIARNAVFFSAPDEASAPIRFSTEPGAVTARLVEERGEWLAVSTAPESTGACHRELLTNDVELTLWVRREHLVPALAEPVALAAGALTVSVPTGLAVDHGRVADGHLSLPLPEEAVLADRFQRTDNPAPAPTHTVRPATLDLPQRHRPPIYASRRGGSPSGTRTSGPLRRPPGSSRRKRP